MADPPPFMVQVDQDSGKIDVAPTVHIPAAPFPQRLLLCIPRRLGLFMLRWSGLVFLAVGLFQAADILLWRWHLVFVSAVWCALALAVTFLVTVASAYIGEDVRLLTAEAEQFRAAMASSTMAAIAEAVRAGVEGREPRLPERTKH